MKTTSILFLMLILLIACKKQPPPEGSYVGTFSGSYSKNGEYINRDRILYMRITSSSANELVFKHNERGDPAYESILELNGKTIHGLILTWFSYSNTSGEGLVGHTDKYIDIEGRWEKLGGEYVITGKFNSIYHFVSTAANIDEEYPVEGSFIIKPNNE
ncbi:MAG: hypothetical protein FD155_536 [Bacteroidetes bacterium]|nr:MAG: hypothetical protein FD155_536 [Bacteroidota bacterium]